MHLKRIELTNFRQHRKLDVDFNGNLIAVLGANGCLAEGTPVRLFDGAIKPVEQIKKGDVLLAFDDATGRLTSSTVFDMIRTSPNQKPKPMLEVTINGEKTCTTYDHPFFAGDGFYPLYQLAWGALEERQRAQLKLLCEQYGAPFDDKTIWQQNSCRDEACARREWVLQDNAEWAYREATSSSGGNMAGESAWTSMCEPFGLQSIEQQGGKPGVVQREVQCVVWGNPWQHKDTKTTDADAGRNRDCPKDVGREKSSASVQSEGSGSEADHNGRDQMRVSSGEENVCEKPGACGIRIKVLEAATYYTIRMREAPYTYCIGRRNCYLTHNCGKSNLIGGIQFALTGAQPGFTKADLTTWGEKEGSVRLFFTAGAKNEEFVITRKTNGDVTLKVGDEVIKQARKVEDALRDRAGLDKDLINQVVFVNQKEIDKILSADPKDREMALQRIAGISQASKIYDYLRTEIAAYDKPQGFDEAIARSQAQLADQEKSAQVCREALQRYDNALKSLPSKEELEEEVDRLAGAQGAVDEYVAVCERLTDAQGLHELALKKVNGMGAVPEEDETALLIKCSELKHEIDVAAEEASRGKEAERFLARMKELSDAVVKAKNELTDAEAKAKDVQSKYEGSLADAKAEVDRIDREQAAAEAEARSLRNLAREASSDGTCPVCGAPASQEDIAKHLEAKLAAAEQTRKDAIAKGTSARMSYDHREAEENAAKALVARKDAAFGAAFAALKNAHDKNVEGCHIDLVSYEVAYNGATPDTIPQIQKKNEELLARAKALKAEMDEATETMKRNSAVKASAKEERDKVSRYAAQIDMLIQSKKNASKRLIDMGIDPDSCNDSGSSGKCREATAKARANLDAYNGILRDMAAEKGRLEAAEKTIEDTKKFIDDLVEKKSLEEKVQAKVDTVKRTRDWFHYKVGPRIVSQNVMKELTDSVNTFLDQFNAPFVVAADEEGCGFRCRFIDGRTMPDPYPEAHMLSGGQKVALAFAFHIAIYMRFGGQLGFLSLDEPTAYLDDANIEHMGELLEKVGAVARNRGLQILMATHEKAIMPFLDTKIDLNALKGE